MDDDRKSSLPPPSEIDAMCDDDKMPDEAETTPETSGQWRPHGDAGGRGT